MGQIHPGPLYCQSRAFMGKFDLQLEGYFEILY